MFIYRSLAEKNNILYEFNFQWKQILSSFKFNEICFEWEKTYVKTINTVKWRKKIIYIYIYIYIYILEMAVLPSVAGQHMFSTHLN